jgi:hypothetical protein
MPTLAAPSAFANPRLLLLIIVVKCPFVY